MDTSTALESSHERMSSERDITSIAREERAARRYYGVHGLLSGRPELRGVHAPADFLSDAVSWGA